MSTRRTLARSLGVVTAVLVLTACGNGGGDTAPEGGEPTSGATQPAGGASATISIADFTFSSPTVGPGAEVTVQNSDEQTHTATADDGGFDVRVDGGASGTFTAPEEAGEYAYHCEIHPRMLGTLTVQ